MYGISQELNELGVRSEELGVISNIRIVLKIPFGLNIVFAFNKPDASNIVLDFNVMFEYGIVFVLSEQKVFSDIP